MELIIKIALIGGVFAVLAYIHFLTDFIFQSHAEAMVKHNNPRIRAKHCLIYTAGFVPILATFCWCGAMSSAEFFVSLAILFFSHFFEDTYIPVFLWAKYLRKPPQMTQPIKQVGVDGYITILPPDAKEGFKQFVETALGKILLISVDQIIHLAFLFPIAWMVIRHLHFTQTISCSWK
jgi:uncharacterized protein DUF3307